MFPRLQLHQKQKLVMTPMLQQALKVLQLNSLELSDLLQAELAENPVLEELRPAEATESLDARQERANEAEASAEGARAEAGDEGGVLGNDTPERASGSSGGMSAEVTQEKSGLEDLLAQAPQLQEHLLAQIHSVDLDPLKRRVAEELIGLVDMRGYLDGNVDQIAVDLNCPPPLVHEVLRQVQRLDPPGVAARDLRECLLLQLEWGGHRGSLAWRLVADHLEDLAHQVGERLADKLKVSLSELRAAQAVVASLEPRPGRPYGGEPNAGVPVDAIVDRDPLTDQWRVTVNDAWLPRLGINAYYKRLMKSGSADEETRNWLKNKYQNAVWLLRGVSQRQHTLRRVVTEIVDVQQGFLEHGASGFQPLTLKEIALRTDLHESTISRVTSNKYVQTPRGVFELKYFFTSSLRTDSGSEASSMAVKSALRELLDEEDPTAPFSDQAIAESLGRQGVHIARRTVAKYREELGLAPAHQRRKR